MKKIAFFIALAMAMALTGCASLTGGSDYIMEITRPDGTIVRGEAHNAGNASEIDFTMTADPETGMPTGMALKKAEVAPGEGFAPVIGKLVEKIP